MAELRRLGLAEKELHQFVKARVANVADAEDIAQQALMQACSKIATFRGQNLPAWLSAIAHNLIIDYYRARKRHQFVELTSAAEIDPVFRTPHHMPVCACGEGLSAWMACIASRVPLEEHVALLLADVYGYRDKEAAAVVGISLPRYKLLLHNARRQLRESAGEGCALVKHTQATAARRPPTAGAAGHSGARASTNGARSALRAHVHSASRKEALRALRGWLLDALGTLTIVLANLQADTWPLELALIELTW